LFKVRVNVVPFGVGATANPPKSDDWKWTNDRDAFIDMYSNDFLRNP
jgi:hypothetical protein